MATFQFELVAPERLVVSAEVEAVVLPGAEGEFQVMPGHAPFLALLGPGIMSIEGGDVPERRLFIDGGFCDVGPQGCTVLAEAALPVDDKVGSQLDELIQAAEKEAETLEAGPSVDEHLRRLATLRGVRQAV